MGGFKAFDGRENKQSQRWIQRRSVWSSLVYLKLQCHCDHLFNRFCMIISIAKCCSNIRLSVAVHSVKARSNTSRCRNAVQLPSPKPGIISLGYIHTLLVCQDAPLCSHHTKLDQNCIFLHSDAACPFLRHPWFCAYSGLVERDGRIFATSFSFSRLQ